MTDPTDSSLLATGVPGLDPILHGGLPASHAYLVTGSAGTGKTSLAMQFLSEGARRSETTVYVSFSESRRELEHVVDAHDWPLESIEVLELASVITERSTAGSSIFHDEEVELPGVVSTILDAVERLEPTRLAVDSLTELRNMADSNRSYRRALFQLKVALEQYGTTAIFVGEKGHRFKTAAESIVHGVIDLWMETPAYGPVQRHLEVKKIRGRTYESGCHDFSIVTGGLKVFGRIRPEQRREITGDEPIRSGVESLDELLGGGIDRGTTTLIMGPSGTGKSTMVAHFGIAAARRGEQAMIYTFTEDPATMRRRAANLGLPLSKFLDNGQIRIQALDFTALSPGEFAHLASRDIKQGDVAFVALDSINEHLRAMPSERALVPHLHDLLTFLGRRNIVTMLVMDLGGLFEARPVEISSLSILADTILYLRYHQRYGAVERSVTVVKHRTRDHDKHVRKLTLGEGGLHVGERLVQTDAPLRTAPSPQPDRDDQPDVDTGDDRDRESDDN